MKLQSKFTVVLSLAFVAAMAATATIAYVVLYGNAEKEIHERATLMLESAKAMRSYTINNIKPIVTATQGDTFRPETVPAFAAMTAFNLLRETHPSYTYREVALNPTNPLDRPVDWEHDIVTHFRNFPATTELTGTRQTPAGEIMYIARPIPITKASCLDCHSTPDKAPPAMVKHYGEGNGFGWQMNEIVGAQIVAVPATVSIDRARSTFLVFMGLMLVAGALVVGVLIYALRRMVVQPIARLTTLCDQVSTGDFASADPETSGDDELSSLGRSFVRMKTSLQKAMRMLSE